MRELGGAIRKLATWPLAGFLLVCLTLTYWQVLAAEQLNNAAENNRLERMQRRIQPGRLITRDGVVILDSHSGPRGWERIYDDTRAFSHLTGYNSRTGLQKTLADALYAQGLYSNPWEELMHGGVVGNNVHLTIDARLQQIAHRAMRRKRGAVIAMDPRDGALLVLYSAPAYDASAITRSQEAFDLFVYDPEKPEINRALQGMYPPGSVFKIFTAAAAIDAGISTPETVFQCTGVERVAGTQIRCRRSGGHGKLSLKKALTDSCNIAFAKLGDELGPERFRDYVKRFHLLDSTNLPLATSTGRMADFSAFKGQMQLAEASFGQGATLITPLAIARLTATIANGGEVIQPCMVDYVETVGNRRTTSGRGEQLGRAVSAQTATTVAGMMRAVVEQGTGAVAGIGGLRAAAKTGSAQHPSGDPHAWFTCFAPYDAPELVVTVIVENGGSGAETAGPIAVEVLRAALSDRIR